MFRYVCGVPATLDSESAVQRSPGIIDKETLIPERFGVNYEGPVFGPISYRWTLDPEAIHGIDYPVEDLLARFRHESHPTAQPVYILAIDDATVFRNMIYCQGKSAQRILYESFRGFEWRSMERIDTPVSDHETGFDASSDEYLDVYVGSVGYFNYGHWLVDELPKIKGVETLMQRQDRQIRLILPEHDARIDSIRTESIRLLLGDDVHIHFIDPHKAWRFRHLRFISPVSYHPIGKSPIAVDYLVHRVYASTTKNVPISNLGVAERIFVTRGATSRRRLVNEEALYRRLAELDFRFVDPSSMSFAEQVLAFSRATVVVGAMGAAMTNTLFCRPTTAVIHLAPRVWLEPFYLDLAAIRGHRYHVLFGPTQGDGDDPHVRDFTIDIDQLESIIAAL